MSTTRLERSAADDQSPAAWLNALGRAVVTQAAPPPITPRDAYAIACAASIPALVVDQHRRHGIAISAEFDGVSGQSQMRLLTNKQGLFGLSQLMNEADVQWLVFKGPVLARKYYPTEASRQYSDIDLLVHPDHLERAIDALLAAGARCIDQNWALIRERQQGEISLVWRSTLIDLHWHFYSSAVTRDECRLDIRAVIERRQTLDMDGFSIYVPDDLDSLIFVATHAVLSGGHRIRWLIDFALGCEATSPDSVALWARAVEYNAHLLLAVMVRRTQVALHVSLVELPSSLGAIDRSWVWLAGVTTRIAPPENDLLDKSSGRAVFSATRASGYRSFVVLWRNLWSAARNRRAGSSDDLVDRSILHRPGGTDGDRQAWFVDASRDGRR